MNQTPKAFLETQLSDVELPEGLAFVLPDEDAAIDIGAGDENDEQALSEFLRAFEDENESLENVGLFPVDADE